MGGRAKEGEKIEAGRKAKGKRQKAKGKNLTTTNHGPLLHANMRRMEEDYGYGYEGEKDQGD
jgi:hypothetical protein